jgi:hypothetical protein
MNMFLKKVECSGVIERKYVVKAKRAKDDNCNKQWVRLESIFNGHVIGERTLSDGYNEWEVGPDEDGGNVIYTPQRFFKAYIVVFNVHRNPVHVLPEDVKIIE